MSKPLASMTGFGRASGQAEGATILVEIKSVNGRGLDIRTRFSPGLDSLDADVRRLVSERAARGSFSVFVNLQRDAASTELVINQQALDAILEAMNALGERIDARRPSLDGIFALKGVLDTKEAPLLPDAEERLNAAVLSSVDLAMVSLVESRRVEGERIGAVLGARLDEIEALTAAAEAHPGRSREAILAKLAEQVATLADSASMLSEDRLHAEALLLATKADIREELDRLTAHVKAARQLLSQGGPIGRKLDFLSQEFNREANTLCSKSNDVGLTAIGLDLKAAIDQLREQVQNLE
ncbi:YicC/YloC family endoribonuclease [Pelagibacterium sediminicola]|uniref:YicC/YloC family endoribonuclease n=1 Tax=Pelagibacterium sediminicola TaxID=2248761 RepID=UPI000E31FFBB|nr:YicC/YloC family endoribonuclease [Pelagibacterium sediminicola]